MLDKSSDSHIAVNAEQQAASARCSAEVCAMPSTQVSTRSNENVTTLDFNQGNIYGNDKQNETPHARPEITSPEVASPEVTSPEVARPEAASPEAANLSAHLEQKLAGDPERFASINQDMNQFAIRAAEMNLPQSEIDGVYKNVDRLLQTQNKAPLSEARRLDLAEQVMRHAAYPFSISQGNHDTCPLTALEVRVFDKNPTAAAAMIADVALTGTYHTKDGQTLRINAAPHNESKSNYIFDDSRTHASEIFQVTAGNIIADLENKAERGQTHGSPNIRFEQRTQSTPRDTGEAYVAYYGHGRAEVLKDRTPFVINTGNASRLSDTLTAITGKSEPGTFIGRDTVITDQSPNVTKIASAADLQNTLTEAKAEGKFPITVFLYSGNEPFWSDGNQHGVGVGHVVNITDFVPGTGPGDKSYALVDNSWSDRVDHGANNPIELNTLYNSMAHADKSVPYLQEQATKARADGSPDYGTEIDILRIQSSYKMASPEAISDKVTNTFDDSFFTWINSLPPREQESTYRKLTIIQNYSLTKPDYAATGGANDGSNANR